MAKKLKSEWRGIEAKETWEISSDDRFSSLWIPISVKHGRSVNRSFSTRSSEGDEEGDDEQQQQLMETTPTPPSVAPLRPAVSTRARLKRVHEDSLTTSSSDISGPEYATAGVAAAGDDEWTLAFQTPIRPRVGDRLPNGTFCDEAEYQRIKRRRRLEETLSVKLLVERTESMLELINNWPNLFYYPRSEVGVRIDIFYSFTYHTALAQSLVVVHALARLLGFMASKDSEARSHKQYLEKLVIDMAYPEASTALNAIVLRFHDVAEYISSRLKTGRFTTDQYLLHATLGLDNLHGSLVSLTSLVHTDQGHIIKRIHM